LHWSVIRHCERSEAIQRKQAKTGLLRRQEAPRNDDQRNFNKKTQSFNFALQKFLAAMQTNDWSVASGIRRLSLDQNTAPGAIWKGIPMSKTASLGLSANSSLFGRLLASIDRALMASARIAIRNGDQPRFGL
jgi:hypothetical protein